MKFKPGDTVKVLDSRIATTPCRVVEVKGSVILIEDASGIIHEVFAEQLHKQMLFGQQPEGRERGRDLLPAPKVPRAFSIKVPTGPQTPGYLLKYYLWFNFGVTCNGC